eukprot:scaffold44334_cov57-Phaeocystis_antarctica.AAC.2
MCALVTGQSLWRLLSTTARFLHVAVTSSPARMTSHARAVAPVLSPLGGRDCGCHHARAALEQVGGRDWGWGWGGGGSDTASDAEANRRYTRRIAYIYCVCVPCGRPSLY